MLQIKQEVSIKALCSCYRLGFVSLLALPIECLTASYDAVSK